MAEKGFQEGVVQLARLYGWRAYHAFDSRRSEPGFPDLTLVRRGRLIFAELKRRGGKPTAEQAAWLDALREVPGIEVYVWRPSELDAIARCLGA